MHTHGCGMVGVLTVTYPPKMPTSVWSPILIKSTSHVMCYLMKINNIPNPCPPSPHGKTKICFLSSSMSSRHHHVPSSTTPVSSPGLVLLECAHAIAASSSSNSPSHAHIDAQPLGQLENPPNPHPHKPRIH